MKALVVEDDNATRVILSHMLKKFDYEVVTAIDGDKAWDILEKDDPPPIVVLDWMMPELTGIELCKRIRQALPNKFFYIVILTSKDSQADVIEALQSGADEFLNKPVNALELKARLEVGKRLVNLHSAWESNVTQLQDALQRVKTLQGFISICSYCKKVRTETSWQLIEDYIGTHSDATFTHGVCPSCKDNVLAEFRQSKK